MHITCLATCAQHVAKHVMCVLFLRMQIEICGIVVGVN